MPSGLPEITNEELQSQFNRHRWVNQTSLWPYRKSLEAFKLQALSFRTTERRTPAPARPIYFGYTTTHIRRSWVLLGHTSPRAWHVQGLLSRLCPSFVRRRRISYTTRNLLCILSTLSGLDTVLVFSRPQSHQPRAPWPAYNYRVWQDLSYNYSHGVLNPNTSLLPLLELENDC